MRYTGLSELLVSVLSGHQLELDDLEVAPAGRRRVIRVTVDGDGPAGRGPDLDQIAEATRAVSQALDDSDLMGEQPYTLEVSSRGVSRPLVTPAHYRRNIGRLLALTLADGSQATGHITATDDDAVSIDVAGVVEVYPYVQVKRAVIQVEMNRRPADDEAADDEGFDDIEDEPDTDDREED